MTVVTVVIIPSTLLSSLLPILSLHSSKMMEFHSLIDKFRGNQDEASFILSSIDITDGLGPLLVTDHCESLRVGMTLMRSMAVALGSVMRNQSNLVMSDNIASMTADPSQGRML